MDANVRESCMLLVAAPIGVGRWTFVFGIKFDSDCHLSTPHVSADENKSLFLFIFNAFSFIRLSSEYFSFRFSKMLNYNRVVFASVARFLLPQHRLYVGRSRKRNPWTASVFQSKKNPGLDRQLTLKQELDIDYESFEDFAESEADFTQLHKVIPSSINSDCETV